MTSSPSQPSSFLSSPHSVLLWEGDGGEGGVDHHHERISVHENPPQPSFGLDSPLPPLQLLYGCPALPWGTISFHSLSFMRGGAPQGNLQWLFKIIDR